MTIKTKLFTTACALTWLGMCGSSFAEFYNFDGDNVRVEPPFELQSETAYTEPRSVRLALDGKARREAVPVPPLKLDGRLLGVSFNYSTTPGTTTNFAHLAFLDSAGKEIAAREYQLPKAEYWERLEKVVAVPPNAAITHARLEIRSRGQKEGAAIFVDNVRLQNLKDAAEFEQRTFALDSFDQWKRDNFTYERLLFGKGGRHLFDWQKSKFGESCAELSGSDDKEYFQYPMKISDLKISPEKSYTMSFFYQTSAGYKPGSAIVMATFYDAQGKAMKDRPRIMLREAEEWTEAQFDLATPPGAETMDLRFRLVRVIAGVHILVNRISFAIGSPQIKLQTSIDSTKKLLSGNVKTVMAPEGSAVTCRLVNQKGETVLSPEPDAEGNFAIELANLPDEKFDVIAQMKWAEGETSATSSFTNYNHITWENDLGILKESDAPPIPWKSVEYDAKNRRVITWNPTLVFSENGGLEQVTTKTPEENLLKAPVRLLINGSDLFTAAQPEGTPEVANSPNHVSFNRRLKGDGYTADLKVRAEYDGMVKVTCRIEATRDLTLNSVNLAYEPKNTDGLICADGGWVNHRVIDLKKEKQVQIQRFFPMIWTGRQDAGIYVCAETLYPQVEEQKSACHVLNYDGSFTTHFVNQPLELKQGESHVVEYAIGVTPFRPRTEDKPQWRFRAGKHSNGELFWARPDTHPHFGYPIAPKDPKKITDWLESMGGKEVRKFNYQIPYFIMKDLPQYAYFAKAWHTDPGMIYSAENTRYDYDVVRVNVAQKSWQDLYLAAFKDYFTRFPFDGVYYDCVSFHQHKQPDGKLRYQLFALREYLQRIYVLQRQINPKTWTFVHSGASICDFNAVFSEIILTGEHYRGPLRKHRYYLEFLSLEEFRIHNCTDFGPLRMFLPQFTGEKASAPDVTTHTLGMVLLHDLYLYPNFVNKAITDACRNRYYAFHDSAETRFRPYWKEGAFASGNDAVQCSVYENSRGEMRIYLNTSDKPQKIRLTGAQHQGDFQIYDPLLQQSATAVDGDEISLEPYMMKMVLAAPSELWKDL